MESLSSGDSTAEALPPCETPAAEMPVCVEPAASEHDADYWRTEVAARLQRYRSRRKPRAPRYPSLRLPFEARPIENDHAPRSALVSPVNSPTPGPSSFASILAAQNVAFQLDEPEPADPVQSSKTELGSYEHPQYDFSAKIIEFPRSAAIPVVQREELAEPILDRPRIVEAPEVVPLPPALGGILIEPAPGRDSRVRFTEDQPQPASLVRRMLAGCADAVILIAALAGFAAVFVRFNSELAPMPLLAGMAAVTAIVLWATYDFLFVVYTGSTPGIRIARLRLTKFDGSPVPRRLRRWRVLASFLSAFSLGLGYLWSALDEDGLCWHDRITRTYLR